VKTKLTVPLDMPLAVLIVSFACLFLPETTAQNGINTPEAKGEKVVKDTVDKINGMGIFKDDHRFLCRVAVVESKYGTDKNTYRTNYHGGIWQAGFYNEGVVTFPVYTPFSLKRVRVSQI